MRRVFGFVGKRKREWEENKQELLSQIRLLRNKMYLNGFHLSQQPFIPEYIGFNEYLNKDADNLTVGRIYHRDGFNISRPIGSDNWMVLSNDGKISVSLKINNMLHAILLLEGLGVPNTSVNDFIDFSMKESNIIEKELSSL